MDFNWEEGEGECIETGGGRHCLKEDVGVSLDGG